MKQINFYLILLANLYFFFATQGAQHGYRFIHEYVKAPYSNEKYMHLNVTGGKCNRTTVCLKRLVLLRKTDIRTDQDCYIHIVGNQFRSNEYRKGPIEFNIGCCSLMDNDNFDIPNLIKQSNFTRCPLKKNVPYVIHNYIPDAINFPPYIPKGRWMINIDFVQQEQIVGTVQWYLKVEGINPLE